MVGCRVVIPLYGSIPQAMREKMTYLTSFTVPVAWRRQYCGVFEAKYGGVTYYLLDNEYYFKREGLYGHYDDAERFAFSPAPCWKCSRTLILSRMSSTVTIGRAHWRSCITHSSMPTCLDTRILKRFYHPQYPISGRIWARAAQ